MFDIKLHQNRLGFVGCSRVLGEKTVDFQSTSRALAIACHSQEGCLEVEVIFVPGGRLMAAAAQSLWAFGLVQEPKALWRRLGMSPATGRGTCSEFWKIAMFNGQIHYFNIFQWPFSIAIWNCHQQIDEPPGFHQLKTWKIRIRTSKFRWFCVPEQAKWWIRTNVEQHWKKSKQQTWCLTWLRDGLSPNVFVARKIWGSRGAQGCALFFCWK